MGRRERRGREEGEERKGEERKGEGRGSKRLVYAVTYHLQL